MGHPVETFLSDVPFKQRTFYETNGAPENLVRNTFSRFARKLNVVASLNVSKLEDGRSGFFITKTLTPIDHDKFADLMDERDSLRDENIRLKAKLEVYEARYPI